MYGVQRRGILTNGPPIPFVTSEEEEEEAEEKEQPRYKCVDQEAGMISSNTSLVIVMESTPYIYVVH